MRKIINPCKCDVYGRVVEAFAKIELKNGKLSIVGVVGPKRNGDCVGSDGQCYEEISKGNPEEGWTQEMLDKFCDIWKEWHLNDMRPYCSHMKQLGWKEHFGEKVKITKWSLKREASDISHAAKSRALRCLQEHATFIPTEEETMYYNLPLSVNTYGDELPEYPDLYEFKERDCLGHSNVEYKTRGWINEKDSELGFIGKACPVCGYKYGTSWLTEEVPKEVIEWLENLPETRIEPAWV